MSTGTLESDILYGISTAIANKLQKDTASSINPDISLSMTNAISQTIGENNNCTKCTMNLVTIMDKKDTNWVQDETFQNIRKLRCPWCVSEIEAEQTNEITIVKNNTEYKLPEENTVGFEEFAQQCKDTIKTRFEDGNKVREKFGKETLEEKSDHDKKLEKILELSLERLPSFLASLQINAPSPTLNISSQNTILMESAGYIKVTQKSISNTIYNQLSSDPIVRSSLSAVMSDVSYEVSEKITNVQDKIQDDIWAANKVQFITIGVAVVVLIILNIILSR